jgi:hypothetical protein
VAKSDKYSFSTIKWLVEAGADPTVLDGEGKNIFDCGMTITRYAVHRPRDDMMTAERRRMRVTNNELYAGQNAELRAKAKILEDKKVKVEEVVYV